MHFRDWESRVIHHTIARISSFSLTCGVQGCDALVGSCLTSLPCFIIFAAAACPNPQEDDAKFREFSKRAEDGPSRAGRLTKTCPVVPNEFRVAGCKQDSRLIIPLGLGIIKGWLGTWDAPELLAVSGS